MIPGVPVIDCDEHLWVLNKPAGLLSAPGRGPLKQDCLWARVQGVDPQALDLLVSVQHHGHHAAAGGGFDLELAQLMLQARLHLLRLLHHLLNVHEVESGKRFGGVGALLDLLDILDLTAEDVEHRLHRGIGLGLGFELGPACRWRFSRRTGRRRGHAFARHHRQPATGHRLREREAAPRLQVRQFEGKPFESE